jgi:hypothetical protein
VRGRVDLISGFDIFIEWHVQRSQRCHRLVEPTMMTLRVHSCAQADADVDVAVLQGNSMENQGSKASFISKMTRARITSVLGTLSLVALVSLDLNFFFLDKSSQASIRICF